MNGKSLSEFYRTREWEKLLKVIRNERLNDEGFNVCEYCGKAISKPYDCIGHHKEYLTEENFTDASISLNPDNVMLVHHKCHNVIHNKLQHSRRSVFLVYGAPLSGKSTYVNSIRSDGDLIIDLDNIWQCVSGAEKYIKPNRLNAVVFGIRDYLLDCIKYRRGKWLNAYIIGGYPLISERERLCKELSAQEIFIDTDKDHCIRRLDACEDARNKDEWKKYIEDWFSKYTPPLKNI